MKWVVCFAPGDFHHFNPSCTTHIMRAFEQKGFKILWINPAPVGVPKLGQQGSVNRIIRRLKSYSRPIRRVSRSFYTFSPIRLPGGLDGRLGDELMRVQIRAVAAGLGIREPLVWIENASTTAGLNLFKGPVVYQLSDKYELSRYASPEFRKKLAANSARLVEKADVVLCTARTLQRELAEVRPDVKYLPHAVDPDRFSPNGHALPSDIAKINPPIIGYYGTLSSSNDQSLIQYAAERRPDWSFVLIGRITGGDWSGLRRFANVHFLGYKPPEQIPSYAAAFDAAFMNWHIDEWMHYAHPLKLREYLAMGLPVVSVPIPEVVCSYSDMVYVAVSPKSFLAQLSRALAEDDRQKRKARRDCVLTHTWSAYVSTIMV